MRPKVYAYVVLVVLALILASCGKVRHRLECREFSLRVCDKWFECYPNIAAGYWVDEEGCSEIIFTFCNDPGGEGCNVDTDDLIDCNDQIKDSACLQLPRSCTLMVDCLVD